MSEDIRKWSDGRYTLMFDEHTFFVWDNENDERMTALNVTKKLNEQQATIQSLQDLCGESDSENAKLRIENEQLRRLFEEMKQPITINLTEEDEKELRKLLGLIDDE